MTRWLFVAYTFAAAGLAVAQDRFPVDRAAILEGLRLRDAAIITYHAPQDLPDFFTVVIEAPGRALAVELWKYSNRAPGYQLLIQREDGVIEKCEPGPVSTYRGAVIDDAGTTAAAAFVGGKLTLSIRHADGQWEYLQAATDGDPAAAVDQYVLYRGVDIIPVPGAECGHTNTGKMPSEEAPTNIASWFLRVRIAYDADFEFYQANGSSVVNTEADINAVQNAVNIVYERDARITHLVNSILVRTNSSDPYTSSDPETLLNQFRTEWNDNRRGIVRDIAHLMTGRNLNGSIIGVAWLNGICASTTNGFGYGLSQSRFSTTFADRVALTAHELGHNWSVEHCNEMMPPVTPCNIMCSGLGGCDGYGSPNFDRWSIGIIQTYANTRNCVTPDTGVTWLDFNFGGFETGSFTNPFNTFAEAMSAAPAFGTIAVKPGSRFETGSYNEPMSIESFGGTASIGR